MDHAHNPWCLKLADPMLKYLHQISDLLIFGSYFAIPIILTIFLFLRKEELGLRARLVVGITAAFIIACGSTHLMGYWNVDHSNFWLEGFIKLITAVVSVPAAIIYCVGIKWFLTFKNPVKLMQEIKEQKERYAEFQQARTELEKRGISDPVFALQTAHVQRLEENYSRLKARMDLTLKAEIEE